MMAVANNQVSQLLVAAVVKVDGWRGVGGGG